MSLILSTCKLHVTTRTGISNPHTTSHIIQTLANLQISVILSGKSQLLLTNDFVNIEVMSCDLRLDGIEAMNSLRFRNRSLRSQSWI